MGKVIDIAELVDPRKLSPLTIRTLALLFLATTFEGYDVGSASYAAPGIIETMGIPRASLAPMFSMGPLGMLIGAPLFGYLGDRIGRKPVILICLLIFGLFSVACANAATLDIMILLRLGVGIGAGGLLPNNIALMSEFAPPQRRALCTVMVTLGMTVGGISAALVTATGDAGDWRRIFWIGGMGPVILAPLLWFYLPESMRFLAGQGRHAELRKLVRSWTGRDVPDDAEISGTHFTRAPKPPLRALFEGRLAWITPVLWATYICIMLANSAMNSWIPTLLRQQGLEIRETALTASMYEVGGIMGGLLIARLIDRRGLVVVSAFFLLACTVVGFIGTPDLTQVARGAVVFVTGFFMLGVQQGMNTSAFIYPTHIRGRGYGFANSVGRLGAIAGPSILGILIAMNMPVQALFMAPTVRGTIGAVLCFILARLVSGTFTGARIQEVVSAAAPPPATTPGDDQPSPRPA